MKDVLLSTGQTATIRTRDELTEGQSRKIEIARSRGNAVFRRLGNESETGFVIPPEDLGNLSDEDFAQIRAFEDTTISVMTVALNGEPIGDPTELLGSTYDALNEVVSTEYAGQTVVQEGPDEKINPLAVAAESTDSSSEALT